VAIHIRDIFFDKQEVMPCHWVMPRGRVIKAQFNKQAKNNGVKKRKADIDAGQDQYQYNQPFMRF
jgi:hypothetical protein